jgi:hypothetical protein
MSIGLAAVLAIAVHATPVTGTASDVDLKQMIGTVTALESESRQVSVITGTGHALRVIVFHADAACRIEVDGVVVPLTRLQRGRIVEVRYRGNAAPYAAERITTRPAPGAGGPR